jgi:Spy/CpxP family protein refolding chaperone
MKFRIAAAVLVLGVAAACTRGTEPVQAEVDQAQINAVDPTLLSFSATNGLPTEPFNASTPSAPSTANAPGAPFPDSLKLTAAQQTQIRALRSAFETANRVDILALKDIHERASAAKKADKPAADVRAILNLSKPILARMTARFQQLSADIAAVLTPAQKAWIAARKPIAPPVGWVGPVGTVGVGGTVGTTKP